MSGAEGSVNSLPEELMFEIFQRLPKKSLSRFRCVCKGLHDMLDSPIFKKRYDIFHNSVSDFAVMTIEREAIYSMEFHMPTNNLYSCVEKVVDYPHFYNSDFVGCCKGIVCLFQHLGNKHFILLNPFNETFQQVICEKLYPFDFSSPSIGFGYDYATEDYKIVILEYVHDLGLKDQGPYLSVYRRKNDSFGQVFVEFSDGRPYSNGVYVECAIHWLWRNKNVYTCIYAFDLETESLRSFPLPAQIDAQTYLTLNDFGGRLCIYVSGAVWVMEEYGNETSWTPLCTIGNTVYEVVGYFPMSDLVLLFDNDVDVDDLELDAWSWLNTKDGSKQNIKTKKKPHEREEYSFMYESRSWICVKSQLRLQ